MKPRSQVHSQSQPDPQLQQSQTRSQSQSPQPDLQQSQSQVNAQSHSQVNAQSQSQVNAQSQSQVNAQSQSQVKAQSQSQVKAQSQSQASLSPLPQSRPKREEGDDEGGEVDEVEFYRRTASTLEVYRRDHPRFLAQHQLESYDDFIERRLPTIVKSMTWIMIKDDVVVQVWVGGRNGDRVFLDRPTVIVNDVVRVLYPNEARLKGLTYAANLYADIEVEYRSKGRVLGEKEGEENGVTTTTRVFPAHRIGVVPIMLHSSMCPLRTLPHASRIAAGECPHDQGGYFVIGGREKVVIAQEQVAVNRLFFTQVEEIRGADGKVASDHVSHRARLRCLPDVRDSFPKLVQFAVMGPSMPDKRLIGAIRVQVPYVLDGQGPLARPRNVPLFVLFRALGVESDGDIFNIVFGGSGDRVEHEMLRASAMDAAMPGLAGTRARTPPPIFTQAAALDDLKGGTRFGSLDSLKRVLEDDLLPNATEGDVRGGEGFAAKAIYLGHLTRRIMRVVLGAERPVDRDLFVNRRVLLSGALLGDLFRDLWFAFRRESLNVMDQEYEYNSKSARTVTTLVTPANLKRIFSDQTITEGINTSFRGAWGAGGRGLSGAAQGTTDFDSEGVVQELARVSYFSYASHIRRVTQNGVGVKQAEPRKLLPSQWGFICPIESPDGASLGLVKHLAVLCHIVNAPLDARPLLAHLRAIDMIDQDVGGARMVLALRTVRAEHDRASGVSRVQVMVNDSLRGSTSDPSSLVRYLRRLRRTGHPIVGRYTSVFWDIPAAQIMIQGDIGRCCRPLYIVPDSQSDQPLLPILTKAQVAAMTWDELLTGPGSPAPPALATSRSDVTRILATPTLARIEYIDTQETMNLMLAMTTADLHDAKIRGVTYTHCEIHPVTVLSAVTATLPLMNHQNGGYTALSLAQTKQAVGTYVTNYASRLDTLAFILHYPQRPLVSTTVADWMFGGNLTHGENLVVAVMCFTGYNQDDGFVLNQDSCDRGMFNLTQFETLTYTETESGEEEHDSRNVFADPTRLEAAGHTVVRSRMQEMHMRDGGPGATGAHLDERGMPLPNSVLGHGDVIMGRVQVEPAVATSTTGAAAADDVVFDEAAARRVARLHDSRRSGASKTYRDKSQVLDRPQGGCVVVDRVYVRSVNELDDGSGGLRVAKVCVRQTRAPQIGDKLASRFAQKGTIGIKVRACEMPFGHRSGLVPDVVINPNAFPKRMTVGHLLEALMAKRSVAAGSRTNADTFEPREDWTVPSTTPCALEMHDGLHRLGDEVMYCGRTGEQLDCDIFLAFNYMGRLKHMAEDKINSRAGEGPKATLTRQPTKGRAAHGGLRVGEMEQQCMLAHGVSGTLKEAFMERSDATTHVVDTRTGVSAKACNAALGLVLAVDGDATGHRDFSETRIPHSLRLLQHELCSMGVDTRLMTVPRQEALSHDGIAAPGVDDDV